MFSSSISCSNTNSKQRKHFSIERRPQMLKDFLRDDSNSCSSSGFKSFPRRPCGDISIRSLIESDLNSRNAQRLLRTRSKAASTTTIFSFQSIINVVKNIPFAKGKSPSILPRSLSRRLSKKKLPKKNENKENEIKVTVTVKDIIRWRSFRDLIEEKSQPLDFASSPHHCNTTTTTGSSISTPSGSNGSSWCDSDFTSEYLPPWNGNAKEYGENDVALGKNNLPCVGGDSTEATTEAITYNLVGPKGDSACEEKEQHSPVSVLQFQFEEDEELFSSFNQSPTNMERTTQELMQKNHQFEIMAKLDPTNLEKWMSVEENTNFEDEHENEHEEEELNEIEYKARQLSNHIKATNSVGNFKDNVDQLLLDFFIYELASKRDQIKNEEFDCEMVRIARAWINGEHSMSIEWGVEHKRVDYVKEMDREGRWSKFEEEQQELALEIENGVLVLLVDELLVELLW